MPNRPLPLCSPPTLRPHHSPRLRGGPTIPMHSPSRLRMSSYKSPPSRPFFLANPSPCHASMHPSPPTFGFKIVLPPLLVTWWGTGPRLAVTGRAPHVMVVCLFVYDVFAGPLPEGCWPPITFSWLKMPSWPPSKLAYGPDKPSWPEPTLPARGGGRAPFPHPSLFHTRLYTALLIPGKATDVYPSLLSAWFTHAFASETLCPLPPPLRQLSAYRPVFPTAANFSLSRVCFLSAPSFPLRLPPSTPRVPMVAYMRTVPSSSHHPLEPL
jgi:hypothetical protein